MYSPKHTMNTNIYKCIHILPKAYHESGIVTQPPRSRASLRVMNTKKNLFSICTFVLFVSLVIFVYLKCSV